jgi:Ni,Fe-hydrogenase III large subunit
MGAEPQVFIRHTDVVGTSDIPVLEPRALRRSVIDGVKSGAKVASLFGARNAEGGVRLYAVLSYAENGSLGLAAADVSDSYPSITPDCPQAHMFEREIAEQWGVVPEGHPWLKPVRFHRSLREGHDAWGRGAGEEILPCVTNFFRVEGEEVHEVAVGPIHAGVIEPGHFRFQCHGEHVFSLEISLGYQHRGVETAMTGGPGKRSIHYAETLAGDTTAGHAYAYCQAVESLCGTAVPERAHAIRAVAVELERMANHIGDLGALAGDVGYLPSASYFGRIRGDFLNMTAAICGNRFGRGIIRPGGAGFDVDDAIVKDILGRLDRAMKDASGAADLLFETPSVLARFENTGIVPADVCLSFGLVGPAARASGVSCDVRRNFPTGAYKRLVIQSANCDSGDVYARALVRWKEIKNSAAFVRGVLENLPAGPVMTEPGELAPESVTVSLVEGWRGEICHVALTDARGKFERYKVVDPSFHNWPGLAMALRGQQISDFPLCNKSFNLSYCGHDL